MHTLGLLVDSLSRESGVQIELRAEHVRGTPLTHLLIYQVAREALANVVRHSKAQNAWVMLQEEGSAIRLDVSDDGAGFEPAYVDANGHFGLQLMRERVELAGGSFGLDASANRGTRVVVRVPAERLDT